MRVRKIIHLDLDAFFCAVEEIRDPSLKGKPFAVGGQPEGRGVISSCSYAARRFGVHSAMPTSRARRLCPELIILSGNYASYRSASIEVMKILSEVTPLLEQLSIDEAFMDVTDLPEPIENICRQIQTKVNRQVRLPCSLGGASNMLVAKIANNIGKAANRSAEPPNAIRVVAAGDEARFLAALPVGELWGVGPKTALRLEKMGIITIGDLAKTPETLLMQRFGKMGSDLWRHAHGIDERPVTPYHEVKSISQEITFEKDVTDLAQLDGTLRRLSEQVGYRLRQKRVCAATVRIKIRWHDFATLTRQVTLPQPVDQDSILYAAARKLFDQVWQPRRPVRLLGVGSSGLVTTVHQPELWETPAEKERRLLQAIDSLRQRYGHPVVRRGLNRDPRK